MVELAVAALVGFTVGAFASRGRGVHPDQVAPGHILNGPASPPDFAPAEFAAMSAADRKAYFDAKIGRPGIRPTVGIYTPGEAEAFLQGGLVGLNVYQLRRGVPGISWALHQGLVRYERHDPNEEWKSIREIWEDPHFLDGKPYEDCEGLSAAVAAERIVAGKPSQLVLHKVTPSLSHAVVQDLETGRLLDPNLTGGMRGRAQ